MATRFKDAFRSYYYDDVALTKAAEAGEIKPPSRPQHADLGFGETRQGQIACAFIDLRGFTKTALAISPDKTVRILQAVILAANAHFRGFGGSVLDYTDGAMAVFEEATLSESSWLALVATVYILSDLQTVVNEDLKITEDHSIRAAAGLEAGNVLWTRLGDQYSSQIKPVSGVTFLAGKNSTSGHTKAWEALMGDGISAFVPSTYKTSGPGYDFQFQGNAYQNPRWFLEWRPFLTELARSESSVRLEYSRQALSGSGLISPSTEPVNRPTLDDAPFA